MQVMWPEKVKSQLRVCHPINSGGTTWLRESDLVFVHKRAVCRFELVAHG